MAAINSAKARSRADELEGRLKKRLEELEAERHLRALPPFVAGGALVVPQGLLAALNPSAPEKSGPDEARRKELDRLAISAVLEAERRLGREAQEMEHENPGYDIESRDPKSGRLLFIEVKGKDSGKSVCTVSRTQILTALNKPDEFILAVVPVEGDKAKTPRYIRRPFTKEPDFGATSVNYDLEELFSRAEEPS